MLSQQLRDLLEASDMVDKEDIPSFLFDGLRDYQKSGKRRFSSTTESCDVSIGGRRDNFPDIPILKGVYTLSGYVACFSTRISNLTP